MRRGTTPKHTFTLPFSVEDIDSIHILYSQDERVRLKKTKSDCILDGNKVSVTLSQEETFRFMRGKKVYIQIRILRRDSALASEIMNMTIDDSLEDEVLR